MIINYVYFIIIHNIKLYRAEVCRFVCVLWLSKRLCCAAKDDIGVEMAQTLHRKKNYNVL